MAAPTINFGLTARPKKPQPTMGKKNTSTSSQSAMPSQSARRKVSASPKKPTNATQNAVVHTVWNSSPTGNGSGRRNTVSAKASPSDFGSGETPALIVATMKAAVRIDTPMPTPIAFAQSVPLSACHFIVNLRQVCCGPQQPQPPAPLRCACTGGQGAEP